MTNAPAAPSTAVATQPQAARLIEKFAMRFGVEPNKMMATLKATAFRQKDGEPEVSNEQMMALLIVADQYGLNPWTKEMYAFPDKANGIIPVVGVDGWSRIINEQPSCNGIEFRQSEQVVDVEDAKSCPAWIECVIYRKDRDHPTVVREYIDEVYRPPFKKGDYVKSGPWQTHTKRMLRHKALIQGARLAFGFVGIYEEDEATRIIEGTAVAVPSGQSATVSKINASITGGGQTIDSTSTKEHKAPETAAAASPATATDAPVFTYAEVRAALEKAADEEAFMLARDMIRGVKDETQRKELDELAAMLATKG